MVQSPRGTLSVAPPSSPPGPEWVRRAVAGVLPASVLDGVPIAPEPDPVSEYRRAHQAHPMTAGLDPDWDGLWTSEWQPEPIGGVRMG